MDAFVFVGFLLLKTILLSSCVSLSSYDGRSLKDQLSYRDDRKLSNHADFQRHMDLSEVIGPYHNIADYVDKSKWMTTIYSDIKTKRISDLIIPGTHDSGTFGITSDHGYLVDKTVNIFYHLGLPEVHYWSRSQSGNFTAQLQAGIRYLDLRIAAIAKDGNLYWWHGLTGDRIEPGLQEIADFAEMNPGEVLVLELSHFATPGDDHNNTNEMNPKQKMQVSDLLYKYLGPHIVPSSLGNNPTLQDIHTTGRNILAYVADKDIVNLNNDTYRYDVIVNGLTGKPTLRGSSSIDATY
ncbi:PI-PLC X domain-containing protein DDB_G0269228-like [Ptychodera flava]|uniref:PI-PLC X domain-containing protein DDB_G0269228-like n=1 Tax=Ptychodera flava TaxID=63121 RepID=UPI00396A5805